MSKCADCKYYHLEFDADGFDAEWCKINNIHLHDNDCPNFKGDDVE